MDVCSFTVLSIKGTTENCEVIGKVAFTPPLGSFASLIPVYALPSMVPYHQSLGEFTLDL